MSTTFNVLDLIFISTTIIVVATAFLRGFVREMFALAAWIISFLVSYFLSPIIAKLLSSYVTNQMVLEVVCRLIIFILVFITFILTTGDLSKELKGKMSNALDRSLGIFYGLIKTLIIFGFIYALTINIFTIAGGKTFQKKSVKESLPKWLLDAKCYNLIRISGEILNPAIKEFISEISDSFDKKMPNLEKYSQSLDEKIEEVSGEEPITNNEKIKPSEEDLGYSKKDVEKMRHLIEIIDK
jgi:uncharacterized membrane protein required for colicin V production